MKSAALIAAVSLTVLSSDPWSAASAQPAGAIMLMRGVYTTPDISARCQAYARKRVGSSGNTDSVRQSVFIACVKKLYRQKYGKVRPAGI